MMKNKNSYKYLLLGLIALTISSCVPNVVQKSLNKQMPESFKASADTTNTALLNWSSYFTDPYLIALIDTALKNNQELNILLQEIEISKNEVRARKGEYLPFLHLKVGSGVEKVGRYTSKGANDANTEIAPGKEFPEPLPDFGLQIFSKWEVDIWRKLRNAKEASLKRYLASIDGKNFMVTHLVSEIATAYYELLALDNHLIILKSNINIQKDALSMVKMQKEAAKVSELAVRKFEAEVLKNRSEQYTILQKILETENTINFLVGRYPQTIQRNTNSFGKLTPQIMREGIPAQLLQNRPDLQQAEHNLAAANLDVKVARANFYPALGITAGLGFQAFNPSYLVQSPQSMLYNLAGDLVSPLVNRNAIKANYSTANAKQTQAVYEYEQTILTAYTEVVNQLNKIENLKSSFDLKQQQVQALNESITISTNLFMSARADYMEVMLTQRDALNAKIELIETQKELLLSSITLYKALGGGWR